MRTGKSSGGHRRPKAPGFSARGRDLQVGTRYDSTYPFCARLAILAGGSTAPPIRLCPPAQDITRFVRLHETVRPPGEPPTEQSCLDVAFALSVSTVVNRFPRFLHCRVLR